MYRMIRRTARAIAPLCMLAFLSFSGAAGAQSTPHAPFLVIRQTPEGEQQRILQRAGLSQVPMDTTSNETQALKRALGGAGDLLSELLLALGCPNNAEGRSVCTETIRVIPDTELVTTINSFHSPTVIFLTPSLGVEEDKQAYRARTRVEIWQTQPVLRWTRTFTVSFDEFECDAHCITPAYHASMEQMGSMIRYMLGVEQPERTGKVPAVWRPLPELQDLPRWTNRCAKFKTHGVRSVRETTDRVWAGSARDSNGIELSSLKWSGCAAS